ncbi:MAG: CRTAC1 family protein [Phycisphaerales bacterium]|nr:CRTAC1 family protein [Phycisphaerales bacterium]
MSVWWPLLAAILADPTVARFTDLTDAVGLEMPPETRAIARVAFTDLNCDGWPDVVLDRRLVFLNTADAASPIGRRFVAVTPTGLTTPGRGAVRVFVDLDNDGYADAVTAAFADVGRPAFADEDTGERTAWQRGRGDGTFGPPIALPVPPRPTIAVAAADLNRDGRLDLCFANSYVVYGGGYAGHPLDVLVSEGVDGWRVATLPEADIPFDAERDSGGRPAYGVLVTPGLVGDGPAILTLGYGRRWNRLWVPAENAWRDVAPETGLDGDAIRHGRYPAWLAERARTDPRFARDDERPFRANGNTFDADVGDIDGDGRLDLLITEITHGWAGESSDRTRLLVQRVRNADPGVIFRPLPDADLDRVPEGVRNWNQGDLFGALADLDHDGRLDVVLSSGDYPDDQRLRVFLAGEGTRFHDRTAALGIDHDGSQQISLADVDGDGDLDLIAGQTFRRYRPEQREGRRPRVRLLVNEAAGERGSVSLRLVGDGVRVNRDGIGAVVTARTSDGRRFVRPLLGPGGHAGKQHALRVHVGLGGATALRDVVVKWPDDGGTEQAVGDLPPGRFTVAYGRPGVTPPAIAPPPIIAAGEGYVGLVLRDLASGETVISRILPGPLDGDGLTSPRFDLARPDRFVMLDETPMDAEAFAAAIRARPPGTRVRISYQRARTRGTGIPERAECEEEVRTIDVVLASRAEWTGTIDRGRRHDVNCSLPGPPLLDPFDERNAFGAAVAEHGLGEALQRLLPVFTRWLEKGDDYHALSRVRVGFESPFRLPELTRLVTEPTTRVATAPIATALELARTNLDAAAPVTLGLSVPPQGGGTEIERRALAALQEASVRTRMALEHRVGDAAFADDCDALLRVPRERFLIGGADALRQITVVRRSMGVRFGELVAALGSLAALGDLDASDLPQNQPASPPASLAGVVEGTVLLTHHDPDLGWIVVGGPGENRYDLAHLAVVIDAGGDDHYEASDRRLGSRAVVDLAGDDVYTGTPEQGPGAALLGAVFIDDRGGNDRYEGARLAAGAAMFGAALLLDRGGEDRYVGTEWSLGAACYGAGMIVDLGAGADVYLGDFLCEGVGGPRGFGAIIDQAGRDLYRANGPTPSAYGTAAVAQSFSQGVGFGFRHYAAGGIGLISDLGGDDRYEAGEFGQGGAYYYGLGILHDAAGRDLYYGNRYGQGFGVHQAVGILSDGGGDDTYWSMTAASQGAAWDIGVGLLLDAAGDDSYQCDGLGQGGASMQGIGMLVDLAGDDRYAARGGATQGGAGDNWYHYDETGAHSLGLLLDLGGGDDRYSQPRGNGVTLATGGDAGRGPRHAPWHGLFIDR